jgi:hypothetical protein
MKLHVIDTSALNQLVHPDRALVRHRLLDEVAAERVVVLATHPLIWEFPATHAIDEPKYIAMADLLQRITRGRAMINPNERRQREIRARRALTLAELISSDVEYVPVFDREKIARGVADSAGIARGLRFAEAEKAESAARGLAELDEEWRHGLKIANKAKRYGSEYAEDIARDAIAEYGRREGVDVAGVNPRDLPSFWSSALIHTARIRAVLVARASPTGNKSAGQIDLMHLEDAASYGDFFAAEDGRLRSFAATVPGLRCEVLSFAEWSGRLVC